MAVLFDDGYCAGVSEDEEGNLTASVVYTATLDNLLQGGLSVLSEASLRGSVYQWGAEFHPFMRLSSRNVSRIDAYHYQLTLNYSTKFESEDPVDWIPVISWDCTDEEVGLFRDRSDDAKRIRNSVADPPDPPLMGIDNILTCRVERNERSYNKLTAFAYTNTINNSAWQGFPKHTARLTKWAATSAKAVVQGAQVIYWQCHYELQFRSQYDKEGNQVGWNYLTDDEGLNYIFNGVKTPILVNGRPANIPQPLDGNGGLAGLGDPGQLNFQLQYESDFDNLNLNIP